MDALREVYEVLNKDKSTYKNSNDEPTPIACVEEMLSKVPDELWQRDNLKILDPCCGNGNFFVPISFKVPLECLHFNDINEARLDNVRRIFGNKAKVTNHDFLISNMFEEYDMVVANPPYALFMEDGKRASKNHNLISKFVEKALSLLKPSGYLVFITPDNWMSLNRNTLIEKLTSLQLIHLDIHGAKKYFKKIGSSFTWYVIQNSPSSRDISVSGVWKGKSYKSSVRSEVRHFIPLVWTSVVQGIVNKTLDATCPKYNVETSCDLHRYTKKQLITDTRDAAHPHKLIHTPKQTVWSSQSHKFQEGFKVFISLTDVYTTFIDSCGMTQSIAFIRCNSEVDAIETKRHLDHPLYQFLNNICRWGNFNNVSILKQLPISTGDPYITFNLTEEEITYISSHN